MVSIGWQVTTGGIPLAVPTLSPPDQSPSTSSQYQGLSLRPKPKRTWTPLSSVFPLRQVSTKSDGGKGHHGRVLSPLLVPANVKPSHRDLNADCVILATSDNVNFRVSRGLLVYASPVFRDFFSGEIGQLRSPRPLVCSPETASPNSWSKNTPPNSSLSFADEPSGDGTPIVHVTETGNIIDSILQFLYPRVALESPLDHLTSRTSSPHSSLDNIKPVLYAAHKYHIRTIVQEICSYLLSELSIPITSSTTASPTLSSVDIMTERPCKDKRAESYPLRVYALACYLEHKPLAEASAYASLRNIVDGVFFNELAEFHASSYFHILDYHHKCAAAAMNFLKGYSPLQQEVHQEGDILSLVFKDLVKCSSCHSDHRYTLQRWWEAFVSKATQNLLEAPRTQRIYSPVFYEDVIDSPQLDPEEENSREYDCLINTLRWRWNMLCVGLKETVEREVAKVEIVIPFVDSSSYSEAPDIDIPERKNSKVHAHRRYASIM